jgi:hypothetical protein
MKKGSQKRIASMTLRGFSIILNLNAAALGGQIQSILKWPAVWLYVNGIQSTTLALYLGPAVNNIGFTQQGIAVAAPYFGHFFAHADKIICK